MAAMQMEAPSPPGGLPPVTVRGVSSPPEPSGGYPRGKPQHLRHPLLEKCSFEQLHRNGIIESRPPLLHFGGFKIHKEHSQVLRIVNISPNTLRLSIIPPTTSWFKIAIDKKGLLAPGMSEEIRVTFTPNEWRYYHDSVKIFCGGLSENLVVPIHAYPSANDIILPRTVDFGSVAIGTTRTRSIPLSSKIPIQFEFEIAVLEEHPDFEIKPLRGMIPPEGTTNVVLTYSPSKHCTSRTQLQVSISQFDFEPVQVTLVGNALPELTKETILRSKQSELEAEETRQQHDAAVAKVAELKSKRGRPKLQLKPPIFAAEVAEKTIDGVKVPLRLDQSATNHILNQAPGKLPLKDLASFIRDQRDAAEARKFRATQGIELEEDDDDVHAQELRFEMQFREVAKSDKDKSLKSSVALGEPPMTGEAISAEQKSRRERHARILQRRVEEDRGRIASSTTQECVVVPAGYRPHVGPVWDENANDNFAIRLQVIDRFLRAGSKVQARVRAEMRKNRLFAAIRDNNVTDRAKCRAWVDSDSKAAAAGVSLKKNVHSQEISETLKSVSGRTPEESRQETTSIAPVKESAKATLGGDLKIPLDFVLPLQLPTSRPSMTTEERCPVEVLPLDNFEVFRPVEINKRLDYKVLQYERFSTPPHAAYMQLQKDRVRLHAGLEEASVRGPCGDIFDGAEVPMAMPESCLLPPQHDPMSLLVPSPDCRTFIAAPEFVECDFEYQLAQMPKVVQPLQKEDLLPQHLQTMEEPFLGLWRRKRRLQDPFEVYDPLPACLLEGGAKAGPRLGADVGGDRLSFLPVGGFARDIPSDTDSDQREDFEVSAVSDERYAEALEHMGQPVASDLWKTMEEVEDRLQTQCKQNSAAVRDKTAELNKDIDHRNKLFLG